ncbi:MAG: nickel-dependent hydrogenase large subunit [Sediminibacterium sp.]|jgi:Ni,Fe-hydrogenase I large subunit|nr:nickel-dependent hydrogenase large subunit [Methanobrevibacter sp.]MBR2649791.1 nickel-dependent hydrogenase large subunit [Sediminibacterium sp.]MCA6445650.1 nickel-dependent hydrogenase large subunit [Chitinophagaceae bacterium]
MSASEKIMNISPVGRVEGDLDVRVYIENNRVVRAHTQAAMFRGFEKIMQGKDYQSGLIVTPRICGICGGSHLYCASSALDTAMQTTLPSNALLLRAIGQITETIQSIPRWFYAIFATDLCNKKFAHHPSYQEVCRRWAAYAGKHFQIGVTASGRPVEVYALFGGQWPHSSYMVPGGVMCSPTLSDITRAYSILNQFRNDWLEPIFLGCSVERYMQIKTWDDLLAWVDEKESHKNSDMGFFIKVAQEFGLDTFGQGVGKYMAFGTYIHKDLWNQPKIETRNNALISPSGFWDGFNFHELDHLKVTEHVKHSWYEDYPAAHPWDEPMPNPLKSTNLHHTDFDGKYSWAKAPRYDDHAVEVGPLARVIMAGNPNNKSHQIQDPLFLDIMKVKGPSVFTRTLARLHEEAKLFSLVHEWLGQINLNDEFYIKPTQRDGRGWGATEAARGALAHWVEIEDGKIKNYQVMAPTTWNVGPNDEKGRAGAIEAALTGIEIADPNDPVEVGLVARSFDSCLVCTVHALDKNGKDLTKFRIN